MLLTDVKGNLESCLRGFEEVCVDSPEFASQWPEINEAFEIAMKAIDKQLDIVDMLNDMTADDDDTNTEDMVSFQSVYNIIQSFYVFSEAEDE